MAMALWQLFGVWWRYLGVNPNTRAQSDSVRHSLCSALSPFTTTTALFYSRFQLGPFPNTLPLFWAFYLEFPVTHDHRSSS